MYQRRAQSSNWEEDEKETWDCQEVDEYKTEGKVQLLRDTYTWYRTAYSKYAYTDGVIWKVPET